MVVAQQMQDGVHSQIADLPVEAVAELLALLLAFRNGDHHVPQQDIARLRVALAVVGAEGAGRQPVHGERQHVRLPVHAAKLAVYLPYAGPVRKQDAHRAFFLHALGVQGGGHSPFHQGGGCGSAEISHPAGARYLMLHLFFS